MSRVEVAFNGPKSLIREVDWSDFHYALAHECLENPDEVEFYTNSDKFVILDNGADELGQSIDPDKLFELSQEIKPDVLILPDKLHDTEETVKMSSYLLDIFTTRKSAYYPELMFVLQGIDSTEAHSYLTGSLEIDFPGEFVKWVGLPYDLGNDPTARRKVLPIVQNLKRRVHLLGMSSLPELVQTSARGHPSTVLTHDSTTPYAATAAGVRLDIDLSSASLQQDLVIDKPWPKLDFSNTDIDRELLCWNALVYLIACKGGDFLYQDDERILYAEVNHKSILRLLKKWLVTSEGDN